MAKKNSGLVTGVLITAALAAGAAGALFLYGKDGAKHRKQIKGWALKAKGEVLEQMEKVQDLSQGAYDGIVDGVLAQYKKLSHVDQSEILALGKELKGHWKAIAREGSKAGKKTVKTVKKVVKGAKKKLS